MSDPVAAHVSLEEINNKLGAWRDKYDDDMETINTKLDAIQESTYLAGQSTSYLASGRDDLYAAVVNILSLLEILNSNGSLNAQNLQSILLSGIGVCCDDTVPATGLVENQCAKAQEMIDKLLDILSDVGLTAAGGHMPTVTELVDAFTVGTPNGYVQLLSGADAGRLLTAMYAVGYGGIGQLGGINDDPIMKGLILNNFGTSESAQSSASGMRRFFTNGYDEPSNVIYCMVVLFSSLSVVNHLWDDPAIWSGDGYDNGLCGEEPPPEGEGFATWGFYSDEFTAVDELSFEAGHIDMQSPTDGNISPTPYDAPGGTLYVYLCSNGPEVDDRSTAVQLFSDDGLNTELLFVPYQTEVSWEYPSTRFIKTGVFGTGGAPSGNGRLIFSWTPGEAVTHCPE